MITYGASTSASAPIARPGQAASSGGRLVSDITRIQQGGREVSRKPSKEIRADAS
jgi:hypothetical protein